MMTIPKPRYTYVYDTVLSFLARANVRAYPVDLHAVCRALGIRVVGLAEVRRQSGLSLADLSRFIGGADGAVFALPTPRGLRHTMILDEARPHGRRRFTMAEECAHVLLGHTADARFENDSPDYDEAVYRAYEQEARAATGLLLCSPKVPALCGAALDAAVLARVCDITSACAAVRIEQQLAHGAEMRASPFYPLLPEPILAGTGARAALGSRLLAAERQRRKAKNFTAK